MRWRRDLVRNNLNLGFGSMPVRASRSYMLGVLPFDGSLTFLADASAAQILSPLVILVLCVVAGVGTVMLLPAGREAPIRKFGAAILIAAGLIFAAFLVRGVAGSGQKPGINAYFWIFSAIAIAGAIRVVTHQRPVYSALYFVMTIFASAGLFILMWAEFMAAALVLIYAGAILVTYVFVIMLASQTTGSGGGEMAGLVEYDAKSREPVLAAAVGFALMGVLLFVIFDKAQGLPAAAKSGPDGSTQSLAAYLFREQLVNLELAGLLLTVAMVGAIVIARRNIGAAGVAEVGPSDVELIVSPSTPITDDPKSIPVYGTDNPRQKAYPET